MLHIRIGFQESGRPYSFIFSGQAIETFTVS